MILHRDQVQLDPLPRPLRSKEKGLSQNDYEAEAEADGRDQKEQ